MAKTSQIDRMIAGIDAEIAQLEATKKRLVEAARQAAPKRTRKTKTAQEPKL